MLIVLCFDQEILFCFLQNVETIAESGCNVWVPLV